MKDKRKEILRDLLGEFATDEGSSNGTNDVFGKDTLEKDENVKPIPKKSDDDGI